MAQYFNATPVHTRGVFIGAPNVDGPDTTTNGGGAVTQTKPNEFAQMAMVKPYIPASKQHANAWNSGDGLLLWDWCEFRVPKGSCKLVSTQIFMKGKDGVATAGKAMLMFFATKRKGLAPKSIGTIGATPTEASQHNWMNHVVGFQAVIAGDFESIVTKGVTIGTTTSLQQIVITPEGEESGYQSLYVAAIAQGNFDFRNTVKVNAAKNASTAGSSPVSIAAKKDLVAATIDARRVFAPGDRLHTAEDENLGVVKEVGSDTTIEFYEDTLTDEPHVVNDVIYNVNPIALNFSFEK